MGKSLAKLIKEIKSDHKADRSPSDALNKIIDDYVLSGRFEQYLYRHRDDLARYLSDPSEDTGMRYRASAAGKCPQQQAYYVIDKLETLRLRQEAEEKGIDAPIESARDRERAKRPARQQQALYNGTFTHLRWHMLFDALHEDGSVITLLAEAVGLRDDLNLGGHIDRLVKFKYLNDWVTVLIDFKSIKERYYLDLIKPQHDHVAQQHAYKMLAFNADLWMMLYENKNTHDRKVYDVQYDEAEIARLKEMYAAMDQWIEQTLTGVPRNERVKLDLIITWCSYCPFILKCQADHPELPELQKKIGETAREAVF